ncbi:MAG: type II toxin-antitoxin system VapC family toxin [Candidatus Methanofastidiosia archaeon]|jgi:predicted nucleic acid-binding protein
MFCLDTTYFIDMVRNPVVIERVTKRIESDFLYTTTFNVFEVQLGSYSIKDEGIRKEATEKLNRVFKRIEILPFLEKDALRAAEISGNLRRKGRSIGADAIIAAVSLNNGCTVVTRNKNHFQWIKEETGLDVTFY